MTNTEIRLDIILGFAIIAASARVTNGIASDAMMVMGSTLAIVQSSVFLWRVIRSVRNARWARCRIENHIEKELERKLSQLVEKRLIHNINGGSVHDELTCDECLRSLELEQLLEGVLADMRRSR